MTTIRTVAVIGAGQMGSGIAQVVAAGGYEVKLYDIASDRVTLALGEIAASLARRAARGLSTEAEAQAALQRISAVATLAEAAKADLVIEAASEEEAVKKGVFAELTPLLGPNTLLASNTSSISITRLASVTDRPERFIGLHFMKPAPTMKLVELVRGIATSASTFETAVAFAESLGKVTTESEDFPAFIVNRILVPMMNEAVFMGLDVALAIMNVLYEGLADSKYRPCPLLVKYVEAGWLGKKSGRGFYDYSGETPVPTR